MPFTAKNLVDAVSDVVVLPHTVVRINEMADDSTYSAADISDVINQDPGLSARLLRIANSPFYGFPSRIDNVPRAITVIGTNDLRDLILAASTIQVFADLPNELVSMETFWRHSLRCGIIARALATELQKPNVERYFTAGLLHDIGYLLIYRELPELASQTLQHSNKNRQIIHIVEQEIIGFDHAKVGEELLKQWKLPDYLIEAVGCHHVPGMAKQYPDDAAIVHIANYLANTMLTKMNGDLEESEALDVTALQTTGLSPEILQAVIRQSELQFNNTLEVMVYDEVA